jgi:hypothetical protein
LEAGCKSAGEADGDDVEAGDSVEVADIGGGDFPVGSDRGGGHDPVVGPDIVSGDSQFEPQAGMGVGGKQVERQWRECVEDAFDERFPAGSVFGGRAVYAVQELGCGDGGYAGLVGRAELLGQAGGTDVSSQVRWGLRGSNPEPTD